MSEATYSRWDNCKPVALADQFFPMQQNIQFYVYNGQIEWVDASGVNNIRKLFEVCAPLSSIILKMGEAFSSANMEVLNANTLKYVRGANKGWENIFNNPNPLQSRAQFLIQLYMYMKLSGYCFGLRMYAEGLEDIPTRLWLLPPWNIEVEPLDKPLYSITDEDLKQKVFFVVNGKRTRLNPKFLMLFKDNTNLFDESTWLPKSRVLLNQYPISTLLSSVEAEITMIQRKGALGILSNTAKDAVGTMPVSPEDKQDLQNQYKKYGLTRDQYQVIITNASLQWQSMTFPTKDLMLHESYTKAVKDLCDGFGYFYELLSHSDRKNLSNVNSFDRMLFQNSIIPQANDIAEQLNRNLHTGESNILLQFDFSHIPALQVSEKDKGDGRKSLNDALKVEWDNGLITRNMWLKDIGRDIVGSETDESNPFNKYKWQLTPEELGIITQNVGNENEGNKAKEAN